MNNKMSYAGQQQLKRTIAGRLKAAVESVERAADRQMNNMPNYQQPPVHRMPDGMECIQPERKVGDSHIQSEKACRNQTLKTAFVFSELISEPMCKKRHRNRRSI